MASNSAEKRGAAQNGHADAPPDPNSVESVINMLETCQLSEEDTEALLTDAYALNRRLKAELARMDKPVESVTAPPRRSNSQLPPIRRNSHQRGVDRQHTQMADLSRIYSSPSRGALGLASSGVQRPRNQQQQQPARRKTSAKRPLERKEWQ